MAIEFQTTVKDGTIEILPEYRERFRDRVRVILLTDSAGKPGETFIDELLARPVELKGFQPFRRDEIYAR